jgi:hypothetical protein
LIFSLSLSETDSLHACETVAQEKIFDIPIHDSIVSDERPAATIKQRDFENSDRELVPTANLTLLDIIVPSKNPNPPARKYHS